MISKRHVLVLIFFVPCIVICAQKKTCVNMVIKLRPIENYRGKLKNCTVSVLQNNAVILKSELKGYKFKTKLNSRSVYKIVFKKEQFVSKHIIVNTASIPNERKINQKLKADISLFKLKNEFKTEFLEKEPISIGYYNELKDEVIWDFEYNRSMVEKIIHTMTKE